jgi:hypothetical protein
MYGLPTTRPLGSSHQRINSKQPQFSWGDVGSFLKNKPNLQYDAVYFGGKIHRLWRGLEPWNSNAKENSRTSSLHCQRGGGGGGGTGGGGSASVSGTQPQAPTSQQPQQPQKPEPPTLGKSVSRGFVEGALLGGAVGCVVGAVPGSAVGAVFGGGPPGAAAGGMSGCVSVGLNGLISGGTLGAVGGALDYWLFH